MDPTVELDAVVDIVVEGGRITRVGPNAAGDLRLAEGVRVIDAAGLCVLPAFVDIHVHFREPGHEYKEDIASGLSSAAAGGFASVCAMPNTSPVNDSRAVTELMVAAASRHRGTRLHPIGAITVGLRGQHLTEMAELKEAGVVAVSDDGKCVQSSAVMRRAFEYAKTFDLPLIQHAEDESLTAGADMHEGSISAKLGLRGWPRIAEDIIVARDILLAGYTGARYHVAHASTAGTMQLVREAKARGLAVTAEVTPHHLLLTDEAVIGYDTACKVNPPLREVDDLEQVRAALLDGTVDAIATDHAPHSPLEKDCEFSEASPGMIGLELCFGLVRSLFGQNLARLVEVMSTKPARIVGLEPPSLRVGSTAALTLVDPDRAWRADPDTFRSKSRNTPFLERELMGRVLMTVVEGHVAFDGLGGEE